jgi:pSer/pThr/pTyr-binding forkhead associated (FHA) protein
MKSKTAGREPSCDLVCEHTTVSRFHARIELADDGFVSLVDTGSKNGTFLNRNDSWVRISKVNLCTGDRIRFGEYMVPLEKFTAVFGESTNVRLEATHFPVNHGSKARRPYADLHDPGSILKKPRRNPSTGKIEEDHNQ